ncbi:MAG: cache domain-containing protein [Sulfuricella sp.]|nr:cache domain-containing protein [Sulfuricella sp.]
MEIGKLFKSSLFARLFSSTTAAIFALFAVMYLLSVPFIHNSVESIEERAAHMALNNVYDTVQHIQQSLESTRQAIVMARKMELQHIVEIVESRAALLDGQVKAGKLSRQQAKETLLDVMRHTHYGHNDYVWAANYRSVLVAHPDPKLNNSDFSRQRDTRSNLIVPPMVEGALAHGDGYYSYWWRRLGEEQPIEKLTYYKHLPTFELVIGTGVYIDDIETLLSTRRSAAIEELRRQLHTTKLAKTGYVYIFDSNDNVFIHPNPTIENKKLSSLRDPVSGNPLGPMLIGASGKAEGLRYKWDSPAEPGNFVHDKISWVRHFQPYGWYICSSVYVDELDESARILRNRLLAVFIATLAISIVLIYLFVSKLVSPLRQLSDTASRIEAGDLDARSSIHRDDEIGVVATAFDGMLDRLRDNILNLDAKVAGRTAELEKANQELKKLDQLKSDFLSTVSHELRTPMTSVVGFTKLVKKKLEEVVFPHVASDAKTARAVSQVRENLDIIVTESERLTLLINDVLDSAKLDAGKVEWHFAPLAPARLMERAVAVTAALAEQKGLVLTWQADTDLPEVNGDETRLLQVLINLISNAVKFTEHGQITLSAIHHEQFVQFSIEDNGVGIAAENLAEVFEKFRQISNTLTDKPHGTGLGLSICQQIVKNHGGHIWVESSVGKGSTFHFTVPVLNS